MFDLGAGGDEIILVDGERICLAADLQRGWIGEKVLARISFARCLRKALGAHSSRFAQIHEYSLNSDRSILPVSVQISL